MNKVNDMNNTEMIELTKCTKSNTIYFSLDGMIVSAKCVDVYDGDTITAAIILFDRPFLFKIRLVGINASEIRNKDLDEKSKAIAARDFLRAAILDKIITIKCGKMDKYGRVLGEIYDGDVFINNELIKGGYAELYM